MTETRGGEDPFAEIFAALPEAARRAWDAYSELLENRPGAGTEAKAFKEWIAACRPGLAQVEALMRLSARRAAGGGEEGTDLKALFDETERDLSAFRSSDPPQEV